MKYFLSLKTLLFFQFTFLSAENPKTTKKIIFLPFFLLAAVSLHGRAFEYYKVEKASGDLNASFLVARAGHSGRYDSRFYTPLHRACDNNDLARVELLIRNGYDVNRGSAPPLPPSPLHIAVTRYNVKLAKLLLSHGAHIGVGETPLHRAVQKEQFKMVKLLLKFTPDVNIPDLSGNTPLHIAAKNEDRRIIKILLKREASVTVKNNNGERPFGDWYLGDMKRVWYLSRDSWLHRYFRKHPDLSGQYHATLKMAKASGKFQDSGTSNRATAVLWGIKTFMVAPLLIGTSGYFREVRYKHNPGNNPYGTFNAIAGCASLGGVLGWGLGAFVAEYLLPPSIRGLGATTIGLIVGAGIGAIAGGFVGYAYHRDFRSNRGLYYGATAMFCIPVLLIRF